MARQLGALERALAGRMPRRGWKLGLEDPHTRRALGLQHGCTGWLDGHRLFRDGDTVAIEQDQHLCVVSDLCVLVAGPVSPEMPPDQVFEQTRHVAPAIELLDLDPRQTDLDTLVATSAFHAGLVVGAWAPIELASLGGRALAPVAVSGEASPPLRDEPLQLDLGEKVRFAAEFLDVFGWKLDAGDLLLLGASTDPPVRIAPGASATVDLGLLGRVQAHVAGAPR